MAPWLPAYYDPNEITEGRYRDQCEGTLVAKRNDRSVKRAARRYDRLSVYKVRVFDVLVYDTDANLTNVLMGEDWQFGELILPGHSGFLRN